MKTTIILELEFYNEEIELSEKDAMQWIVDEIDIMPEIDGVDYTLSVDKMN